MFYVVCLVLLLIHIFFYFNELSVVNFSEGPWFGLNFFAMPRPSDVPRKKIYEEKKLELDLCSIVEWGDK